MSLSGLVVLEGKWSPKNNRSVKPLFDVLIDMKFGSPHEYYFDSFANGDALSDIIQGICGKNKRKRYIYLGAHGDHNNINGSIKEVSRTVLRGALRNVGGGVKGFFLGSCLFGNERNANKIFSDIGVPRTVRWIAGYNSSVDWIDSSVLDMLFWNTLFEVEERRKIKADEVIRTTCDKISNDASGLVQRLGFQVFARPARKGGPVRSLIVERSGR